MTTHQRFTKLISKGVKIRCKRSGVYFHKNDMNSDGEGGYIAKIHDYLIHDQLRQRSKYQSGPDFVRPR